MEYKTKIDAEEGKQDILITREFDLPVELLFKAHAEPELFEQWMSHENATTKVLKLECRQHGSWQFETIDTKGNKVFGANGVFHEFTPDKMIIRTFEMENTPFPVQLEFLEFEKLTEDSSRLKMQIVYKSIAHRDQLLQMPFASGLSKAHDRLEKLLCKTK
jgi:uncharacterized protein YndB with AHSA1/START domain